ncbi:MAG: hypothetical protein HYR71_13085, partial [Chloroflexi bacterium]|nr:hypothetical protein [Chloroflexota bacterium]
FWTFTFVTGVTHYERMTTAVYSTSLRLLEEIGYWDLRAPVEDGRLFFRAFFALKGQVEVVPIYLPIGLDAVASRNLWTALSIQFRQMRRWAWTVSNLPFIAYQWQRHPEISWRRKLQKCYPYVESLLIIPASWFVITMGGILPGLINPAMQSSVFGWPLSLIAPIILAPSVVGVIAGLAINLRLRAQYAPRPRPVSRLYRVLQWGEWLLLPLAGVVYFSVPYLQSYWRLLLGNDLEYERTPK